MAQTLPRALFILHDCFNPFFIYVLYMLSLHFLLLNLFFCLLEPGPRPLIQIFILVRRLWERINHFVQFHCLLLWLESRWLWLRARINSTPALFHWIFCLVCGAFSPRSHSMEIYFFWVFFKAGVNSCLALAQRFGWSRHLTFAVY